LHSLKATSSPSGEERRRGGARAWQAAKARYAPGLSASMTPTQETIETAAHREMLRLALSGASGSAVLLVVASGFIAWLGYKHAAMTVAAVVVALGLLSGLWRWGLRARYLGPNGLEVSNLRKVVLLMELNAALTGAMWILATLIIYPSLTGMEQALYVIIACGSIATATTFMSMAGRSFFILMACQVGSLALVSAISVEAGSYVMVLLACLFGLTMARTASEFRDATLRSLRHGFEADWANESLRHAKEAAESANLAKSQFLATMSHEIRTPMNGVLGALELLRETTLETRQRRLVKTAAASGESLMLILNDVLDHSKIEAGKLTLSPTPMSLHSVVTAATGLFKANAEQRGLTVTLNLGPGVPDSVVGDGPRLKQVLLNLIGNGVKFTETGGVTVVLTVPNETPVPEGRCRVRFEVRDTGIGIPPDQLAEVFMPFHQVHSARARQRGGTGLGLAISQRIVEAMGGRISATSRLGTGSSFFFDLNLELAYQTPTSFVDTDFGLQDGHDNLRGVVLLVEDNVVNRMIGAEMLRSLGLDVLEAEDGHQGAAIVENQKVDLVLMDIQMPVLDGYGSARRVREREARLRLPRVPICALTANAFEEDAARAAAAGMDGHLAKPYSRAQLYDMLRRWL
jgi:two-component system, sensor histidine kinase